MQFFRIKREKQKGSAGQAALTRCASAVNYTLKSTKLLSDHNALQPHLEQALRAGTPGFPTATHSLAGCIQGCVFNPEVPLQSWSEVPLRGGPCSPLGSFPQPRSLPPSPPPLPTATDAKRKVKRKKTISKKTGRN